MHVNFEMTDDIMIAKVSGEVDHHSAKHLRDLIDGTYEVFSGKNLILDFTNVPFMDSSGIGMIMGRYNVVNEKGGRIFIYGCSDYMRKILHMSGIFTIVSEISSVEKGIEILRNND